ncbi:MAG: LiaF transmembrane domain-containing protein [Terriglobales bacterium]
MYPKLQAALIDVIAGTILVMLGFAGLLVRLGVLDFSSLPQWTAIEHWWPLLLIIVGLVVWLAEPHSADPPEQARGSVEIRYGK